LVFGARSSGYRRPKRRLESYGRARSSRQRRVLGHL
jgi:hypothetical protein